MNVTNIGRITAWNGGVVHNVVPYLIVRWVGGQAPVEGEGELHGFPFYLRLRSTSTLWIAEPGEDPVDVGEGPDHIDGWEIKLDAYARELGLGMLPPDHMTPLSIPYTGYATKDQAMMLLAQGAKLWNDSPHIYRVPAPSQTELLAECDRPTPRKPWENRPFTG